MKARIIITVDVVDEDEAIIWETDVANALASSCVDGEMGEIEFLDED